MLVLRGCASTAWLLQLSSLQPSKSDTRTPQASLGAQAWSAAVSHPASPECEVGRMRRYFLRSLPSSEKAAGFIPLCLSTYGFIGAWKTSHLQPCNSLTLCKYWESAASAALSVAIAKQRWFFFFTFNCLFDYPASFNWISKRFFPSNHAFAYFVVNRILHKRPCRFMRLEWRQTGFSQALFKKLFGAWVCWYLQKKKIRKCAVCKLYVKCKYILTMHNNGICCFYFDLQHM